MSVSNKVLCNQAHSRGCEDNGKMNQLAKVTVNEIINSFMSKPTKPVSFQGPLQGNQQKPSEIGSALSEPIVTRATS